RPKFWLFTLPVLAMNLMSQFPDTQALDSHYLTPALPGLCAAAIAALPRTGPAYGRRALLGAAGLCLVATHFAWGGTPLSLDFPWRAFAWEARSSDARAALAQIPDGASVQAPYALLPHLAERPVLARPPPPERNSEWLVLDVGYRARYLGNE